MGLPEWGCQPEAWAEPHSAVLDTLSHTALHQSHIVTHCVAAALSHTALLSNATKALHSVPPQVHQHQALDRQQLGRYCQPNIDNTRPCVTVCPVNIDK